jgi:hypothetical protein
MEFNTRRSFFRKIAGLTGFMSGVPKLSAQLAPVRAAGSRQPTLISWRIPGRARRRCAASPRGQPHAQRHLLLFRNRLE